MGSEHKSRELNHYIESARARIYAIHRQLEIDRKPISTTVLKDRYLVRIKKRKKTLRRGIFSIHHLQIQHTFEVSTGIYGKGIRHGRHSSKRHQ